LLWLDQQTYLQLSAFLFPVEQTSLISTEHLFLQLFILVYFLFLVLLLLLFELI